MVRFSRKDYDGALQDFNNALKIERNVYIFREKSKIIGSNGNKTDAIEAWKMVIQKALGEDAESLKLEAQNKIQALSK